MGQERGDTPSLQDVAAALETLNAATYAFHPRVVRVEEKDNQLTVQADCNVFFFSDAFGEVVKQVRDAAETLNLAIRDGGGLLVFCHKGEWALTGHF